MARSTSKNKSGGTGVLEGRTEAQAVAAWRLERFVRVLRDSGLSDDDIDLAQVQMLVDSEVYPGELSALIAKGCEPDLAIRILA